ncbi:CYFA0S09e01420g1_1 [Cyberlindnera fabianii]|uniref:CYFA0S09e01420g1_1 n=1 Tax=Cyberlindnera fabianii TaxID=36022 RepID=A0A061AXN9_CYBFA|nr:putative mitochondrial hydrolase FMP41 [Cyberlindnera fabianii]CDR42336.1 CYFA0S09e01420g1_1 [Cyberlindnera fabianii]
MSFQFARSARKILCIGRNYAAHIAELNNAKPQQPFYFLKPSTSILEPSTGPVLIPKGVVVHHEVELAVILNKELKNLNPETFTQKDALDAVEGYALAIDFTARNVQDEAKKKGLPWTIGKGFDTFCPLSYFIPKEKIPDPYNVELYLKINGEEKQRDLTSLMIFPIHKILSTMSSVMTLEKGDIILTGTPKGVGKVVPGDHISAGLSVDGKEISEGKLELEVEQKPGPYEYKET